jgi:hypothetical protein
MTPSMEEATGDGDDDDDDNGGSAAKACAKFRGSSRDAPTNLEAAKGGDEEGCEVVLDMPTNFCPETFLAFAAVGPFSDEPLKFTDVASPAPLPKGSTAVLPMTEAGLMAAVGGSGGGSSGCAGGGSRSKKRAAAAEQAELSKMAKEGFKVIGDMKLLIEEGEKKKCRKDLITALEDAVAYEADELKRAELKKELKAHVDSQLAAARAAAVAAGH